MTVWKTIFSDGKNNTAIAADATETIASSQSDIATYGPFNKLRVTNTDVADCTVRLDGVNESESVYECPANSILTIDPEEGITFKWVVNLNGSSVTQTADAIVFQWWKEEFVA